MLRTTERTLFLLAVTTVLLLTVSGTVHAQAGVTTKTGTLADGATYLIEVPANWNGTLFLYSHGYVISGSPNPARDVAQGDLATRFFMLSSGFALAGSSYATTGWAIHEAIPDQIAVLDLFKLMVGEPKRTIAWGHSPGRDGYRCAHPEAPRPFRCCAAYVRSAVRWSGHLEHGARLGVCFQDAACARKRIAGRQYHQPTRQSPTR